MVNTKEKLVKKVNILNIYRTGKQSRDEIHSFTCYILFPVGLFANGFLSIGSSSHA